MISKYSKWNTDLRVPFLLKPIGKDYLWGGNRLKQDFGKKIKMEPLAETWECSTHPDGSSIIDSGRFKGQLLRDIIKKYPELVGTHFNIKGELPILIKLIDAKQDLSIQVHPDDSYAKQYEDGALGKTEMWYILEAEKDSKLVYGFYYDMDRDFIKKKIEDNTVERYFQKIPVKKDDVFYIEAGCVHAIGSGILLAEVQENSNLTYRLYDYKRVDKEGNYRKLEIEKALDVADLRGRVLPRQPMRTLQFKPGYATELLCRCKYFQVKRVLLNINEVDVPVKIAAGSNSFQVMLCVEGKGRMSWDKKKLCFTKGDCIFIPANSVQIGIEGKAKLLNVSC